MNSKSTGGVVDKKHGIAALAEREQSFWVSRILERSQSDETRNLVHAEARHSLRRRYRFDALINHGLSYSQTWPVRDLSLEGAFVQADSGQLPKGATVEIVLRYRYKGRDIEVRLPAVVARIDADGMALSFGRYDNHTYTDLTNLLYAF
jgi:hypothetical protein